MFIVVSHARACVCRFLIRPSRSVCLTRTQQVFAYGDEQSSWEYCKTFAETIANSAELRDAVALLFVHVPGGSDAKAATAAATAGAIVGGNTKVTSSAYCGALRLQRPVSIEGQESWDVFRKSFTNCVTVNPDAHKVKRSILSTTNVIIGVLGVSLVGVGAWYLYTRFIKSNDEWN